MTATSPAAPPAALRLCALAVAVLEDVDATPQDDGVLLAGDPGVLLPWSALAAVAGRAVASGRLPADEPGAVARVSAWMRLHRLVADLGGEAGDAVRSALRPLVLPRRSALAPGASWPLEPLPGGAAVLGAGAVGLLEGPDAPATPLPPDVAEAAGVDVRLLRRELRARADELGALAVERLRRDASAGRVEVLRPVGGCDVPTLLASRALREHLAAADGTGMRAVAVPCRTRGWFDLARVDPAFVGAAWTASDLAERAFARPLLVTADEVAVAAGGDRVVASSLADPVRGRAADVLDVRGALSPLRGAR